MSEYFALKYQLFLWDMKIFGIFILLCIPVFGFIIIKDIVLTFIRNWRRSRQ